MSQWKEWRMYHFKMRFIAFHFLLFLVERVPKENFRLLLHYGFYLEKSSAKSFVPNNLESKLDFFIPYIQLFQEDSLLKDESRVELLGIIENINSGELGRDDMILFTEHYNIDVLKEWMSPSGIPLSTTFRDRCL